MSGGGGGRFIPALEPRQKQTEASAIIYNKSTSQNPVFFSFFLRKVALEKRTG